MYSQAGFAPAVGARSTGVRPGMPAPGTLPPASIQTLPYGYAQAGVPPRAMPAGTVNTLPPGSMQSPEWNPADTRQLQQGLRSSAQDRVDMGAMSTDPYEGEKERLAYQQGVGLSDVVKGFTEVPPGVIKMFPMMFLLFSLACFIMPIYLVLYVGDDAIIHRWLPSGHTWVVLLPAFYAITFFVHTVTRRPNRFLIVVSLIGSCVLLLVLSNMALMSAYDQSPMLASTDCFGWASKREVQQQRNVARDFYATCTAALAKKGKMKFAAAVNAYRIQDCPDYNKQASDHPEWKYLENLENTQRCSGWCKFEQPLWTRAKTTDACSPVVAQVLRDKAEHCMKQVVIYTVFTLCVVSVLLLTVQPLLRKYNIEW